MRGQDAEEVLRTMKTSGLGSPSSNSASIDSFRTACHLRFPYAVVFFPPNTYTGPQVSPSACLAFFISLSFLSLSFLSLSFLFLSFLSLSFLSLFFLSLSFLSLFFLSLFFFPFFARVVFPLSVTLSVCLS